MARIEEKYEDVLQNIEWAIVSVFREYEEELVDYDVDKALNALITDYRGEQIGRTVQPRTFTSPVQDVYDRARTMCEWRLGRRSLEVDETREPIPAPDPLTLDEILACLKRLRKSVQKWNKQGGRQGYLQFVSEFIL